MTDKIEKMFTEILDSLKTMEDRIVRLEASGVQNIAGHSNMNNQSKEKKSSIKEFLIACAPSGGVQTTLAIAYYLETSQGLSSFNKNDLETGFRAAKETIPGNINDKVNMCIANGHLMEAEEKKENMKAWVLTRSGEAFVENGFSKTKK